MADPKKESYDLVDRVLDAPDSKNYDPIFRPYIAAELPRSNTRPYHPDDHHNDFMPAAGT